MAYSVLSIFQISYTLACMPHDSQSLRQGKKSNSIIWHRYVLLDRLANDISTISESLYLLRKRFSRRFPEIVVMTPRMTRESSYSSPIMRDLRDLRDIRKYGDSHKNSRSRSISSTLLFHLSEKFNVCSDDCDGSIKSALFVVDIKNNFFD
jgi:hypothetical protein